MIWEAEFLSSLKALHSPFLNTVMAIFSMIGYNGFFVIALGLILLIFTKTRKTGFQVLMAVVIGFIIGNLILKNIVCRVRPYEAYTFLEPMVPTPPDTSFPSGHTTNVFAAATAIFLNHKKAGIAALVIASLVAFSRMYNAMHYPTDVLAGIVIGVGSAILVYYLVYPACEKGVKRLHSRKEA